MNMNYLLPTMDTLRTANSALFPTNYIAYPMPYQFAQEQVQAAVAEQPVVAAVPAVEETPRQKRPYNRKKKLENSEDTPIFKHAKVRNHEREVRSMIIPMISSSEFDYIVEPTFPYAIAPFYERFCVPPPGMELDFIHPTSTFESFKHFEDIFNIWKRFHFHPMRIASSEALRDPDGSINQKFQYRYVVYHCAHYGEPRKRGDGVRPNQSYLPCGCKAKLRLNYDFAMKRMKVTTMETTHSHPIYETDFSKVGEGVSQPPPPRTYAHSARRMSIGTAPSSSSPSSSNSQTVSRSQSPDHGRLEKKATMPPADYRVPSKQELPTLIGKNNRCLLIMQKLKTEMIRMEEGRRKREADREKLRKAGQEVEPCPEDKIPIQVLWPLTIQTQQMQCQKDILAYHQHEFLDELDKQQTISTEELIAEKPTEQMMAAYAFRKQHLIEHYLQQQQKFMNTSVGITPPASSPSSSDAVPENVSKENSVRPLETISEFKPLGNHNVMAPRPIRPIPTYGGFENSAFHKISPAKNDENNDLSSTMKSVEELIAASQNAQCASQRIQQLQMLISQWGVPQ